MVDVTVGEESRHIRIKFNTEETEWLKQNVFRENFYTHAIKQAILFEISEKKSDQHTSER
jgi:SHS2 domain-containing protein